MATWIKRSFEGVGITQVPPGPGLKQVQRRHATGTVMLLIDCSGSMQGITAYGEGQLYYPGSRLEKAIHGARVFVDEAVEALYSVGMILWNSGVAELRLPSEGAYETRALLHQSSYPAGGTDLYPALVESYRILKDLDGDRVVAIFGDGDLGTPHRVHPLVEEMKRAGIRFVTRGLGNVAAEEFGRISDEEPEKAKVESEEELSSSIASMVGALRAKD